MANGNIRCPHCGHWMCEIEQAVAVRLRIRCGHCKRQWICEVRETTGEWEPSFRPVLHRVVCAIEETGALQVMLCPVRCNRRIVSEKCPGQPLSSAA